MNKNTKESIWAILIIIAVFLSGYFGGDSSGYTRGLSEGVAISKGDKWDCAYSYSTGFLMCDRTPKYK
jgi:hypothetical protein